MDSIKVILPKIYTSPYEVMKIKDKNTALYLHLLFALEDKNLSYISGVFISNVLDALRTLEDNSESLVRDIRRGSINRNLNIDEETRKTLYKEQKSSTTIVKDEKVYPNDPCPCGSGKKYKKCCGKNK